jgi:hypothetical protein
MTSRVRVEPVGSQRGQQKSRAGPDSPDSPEAMRRTSYFSSASSANPPAADDDQASGPLICQSGL